MSDFRLKVVAETQAAERNLKQVGEVADKATKARSLDIKVPNLFEVTKTFQTLERDVKSAANTINTFYKVGKALPGSFGQTANSIESIGKGAVKSAIALNNNNTAAEIFSNTLKGATGAAGQLVTTLAKVGFATFAIKETVGVLQAAFNGFFNNTIGREIKLRETILKTQTTLASTNKVFKDGKEIIDPYQKIVTLTGAVKKNIDSIRERSIALAGVTSNDVIEVFGIVASQIGLIGGGLKEAEDLAIQFAAALGTFGLPIYQARQEIGSILRGDVGPDSILAKSLQISSKDIAEAKTKAGGVVKFLEERLAAAVAGQRIAAQGFSGVISNIKDLGELIGQNFGRGLLDPLLSSLTAVFETLFKIRTQVFAIATGAGETVGRVATLVTGLTAGRTGIGKGVDPSAAATAAQGVANKAFTEIESVARRTVGAISQVIAALQPTALILADAFRNVAEAFVQIKVGSFEALASALANVATAAGAVAPAFATIFNLYARFLNTPIVKYFAEVSTVLALLKRAGLDAATSLLLFGKFIISSVIPALGVFGTAAGAVVAGIAAIGLAIGKLVLVLAGLASALVTPAAAIPAVAAAFQALSASLTNVGNQAVGANTKLANLGKGLTALGATAKAAGAALLASLGWVVAFQVGIAVVVDALGRFQRVQEDKKSSARAAEALRRLQTTYKNVGEEADSATKSARDFELALVNAEYDKAIRRISDIKDELNDLKYEAQLGIQTWGEFFKIFDLRRTLQRAAGRNPTSIDAATLIAEEAKLREEQGKRDAARNKEQAAKDVQLAAQNRTNLEKEIKELRRAHESELFSQRQTLAQKEVEIFQAAGELRIRQMERANAKLIEGEEGASRVALEALNTYLVTKEQGEIEIEAAKKGIVIEVANLEKTIADYRFETEKKIAEIRKRAGENEMAMADARRQAEGQNPRITGGGAFDTGLRTGPAPVIGGSADYHQDLSFGPGVDLRQQRELMVQLAQAYDALGRKIVLSNAGVAGREFPLSGTAQQQNEFILSAQAAHRNRPGGGRTAIDFYAPTKTDPKGRYGSSVVNQPMLAPTVEGGKTNYFAGGAGGAGVELTKDGASILKLIHGRTDIPLPSGGNITGASTAGGGAATPTPALQSLDVGAPSIAKYEESVRGLAGAMERLRQLQAALINAKTVEAFENIAKSVFQPVELEQYQDQLYEVQLTYDAVATSSAKAFNPERSKIAVEQTAKIAASNRELGQIIQGINARSNIDEAKKNTLIQQVTARHKEFVASLKEEELTRYRIQTIAEVTQIVQQIKQQTAAIYEQIEADAERNRLEAEGASPEKIQAELAKLALRNQLNKAQELLTQQLEKEQKLRDEIAAKLPAATDAERKELQAKLDAALARIKELEERLKGLPGIGSEGAAAIDAQAKPKTPSEAIENRIGTLKKEIAELTNIGNIAIKVADGIGAAFSTAFQGLITGSMTAREALGSFFQSVSQMFIQMATEIIAKQLVMITLQLILKALGAVAGAGGGGGTPTPGSAPQMTQGAIVTPTGFSGQFAGMAANGATFANGIAKFANGGIVNSPTLFKFADGGTTKTGLMGEAGPEAIMPLSRGSGGRLGVDASGLREAMNSQGGGGSGSPVLNMSFESTNIGGVEYVSRDQLEQAMAETRRAASRDGAQRGMSMTLDKLQQSPSTRNRVGIR